MHTIYTIGHSTRTTEQFLALLKAHGIEELVDVRTIPRSRHNPQFGMEELAASLQQAGIAYTHLGKLGGLRHASKDSVNLGWQNTSFRGFADYMATPAFTLGLDELTSLAEQKTVTIMCAEAMPWRCHRSLISDALTIQGWQVRHIQSRKTANLLSDLMHAIKAQLVSLCWLDVFVALDVSLLCRAVTYLLDCNPSINKLGA